MLGRISVPYRKEFPIRIAYSRIGARGLPLPDLMPPHQSLR